MNIHIPESLYEQTKEQMQLIRDRATEQERSKILAELVDLTLILALTKKAFDISDDCLSTAIAIIFPEEVTNV